MTENQTLIHFSIQISGGKEAVAQLIQLLQPVGKVEKISSVYKKLNNRKSDDFHGSMEGVVKMVVEQETKQLEQTLATIAGKLVEKRQEAKTKLSLLAYSQQIIMTPELTLPSPTLFAESLITRCAAEVWPSYEHPILKKTLQEMAKEAAPVGAAEFLWQGKSFVAF